MIGEYLIEQLAQIPTEVEYASEFRHRNTPMTRDTLVWKNGMPAWTKAGEVGEVSGVFAMVPPPMPEA